MALNFKSLFSRKKKRGVADDGDEPFFTGATLGPGLDDGLDDADGAAFNSTAANQPRGFADILNDDDWGVDLDDDDSAVLGHGARKRRRLLMLAGVGVVAALVAGGAATWWMLGDPSVSEGPQMADMASPAPSDPIGSGEKISLPMPAAPGLSDMGRRLAEGQATPSGAVLDSTAATDKSVARRPWLAQDSAEAGGGGTSATGETTKDSVDTAATVAAVTTEEQEAAPAQSPPSQPSETGCRHVANCSRTA